MWRALLFKTLSVGLGNPFLPEEVIHSPRKTLPQFPTHRLKVWGHSIYFHFKEWDAELPLSPGMKQPWSTWPCLALNLWKLIIYLDFTYNEPFPLSYINSSLVSGEPPHGFLGVWPPCWSNRTLPWWTEMPLGFISRLTSLQSSHL